MTTLDTAKAMSTYLYKEANQVNRPNDDDLPQEFFEEEQREQEKQKRRTARKERVVTKKTEQNAKQVAAEAKKSEREKDPEMQPTDANVRAGLDAGIDAFHQTEVKAHKALKMEAIDLSEPEKNGSVIKVRTREGFGDASPGIGDMVWVHYTARVHNKWGEPADIYDSTYDRNEPWCFECGRGKGIKAFDLAVKSMRQGETAVITAKQQNCYLPDNLSILYNERSGPKIPPGFKDIIKGAKKLVFEIELVKWHGGDISPTKGEETIFKSTQREGAGYKSPNDDTLVTLYCVGYHEGRKYLDETIKCTVSECLAHNLPEGMPYALKKMRKGERALLHFKPKWAYGKLGKPELGIPPNACVDFDVDILDFYKYKEIWEYGTTERLELCEKLRLRANDLVKEQQYALAQAKYQRIWNNLFGDKNIADKEQHRERDRLYIAANLNMALCMIKRQMTPFEAVKHCTYVLEMEPDNVKAYYRRAQARMLQDDYEEAAKDFRQVLELDPDNAAAKRELMHCREGWKIYKRTQMLTYRSLFRFDKHKRKIEGDDEDLTPEQRKQKQKEERKLQKQKEKAARKKQKDIAKSKARKNKRDSDDATSEEDEVSSDEESSESDDSSTTTSSGSDASEQQDLSASDSSSDSGSDSSEESSAEKNGTEAKTKPKKKDEDETPAILKSIDRFKTWSRQSGLTNRSAMTAGSRRSGGAFSRSTAVIAEADDTKRELTSTAGGLSVGGVSTASTGGAGAALDSADSAEEEEERVVTSTAGKNLTMGKGTRVDSADCATEEDETDEVTDREVRDAVALSPPDSSDAEEREGTLGDGVQVEKVKGKEGPLQAGAQTKGTKKKKGNK